MCYCVAGLAASLTAFSQLYRKRTLLGQPGRC